MANGITSFDLIKCKCCLLTLSNDGEAKFWLEPMIELAKNYGLSDRMVREALRLIAEHEDEIRAHWHAHFDS
jgi:hypothetical protein